jgi:putative ATPase
MECLPDNLRGRRYFHPTDQGLEGRIREQMREIAKRRGEARRGKDGEK